MKKKYRCRPCGLTFKTKRSLFEHMETYVDVLVTDDEGNLAGTTTMGWFKK